MPPRATHGERRRAAITAAAIDLSTSEGLDALSFQQLADEVGLTKAGVAAHFASKQALQLEVIAEAARAYAEPLVAAAAGSDAGLPRLRALAEAWLTHLEGLPYRGGCFFAAAAQAFAGRPGPVRDAVAHHTQRFLDDLEEQARLAQRLGELPSRVDPELLAFQIHALAYEANLRRELLGADSAFDCARRALASLIDAQQEKPA